MHHRDRELRELIFIAACCAVLTLFQTTISPARAQEADEPVVAEAADDSALLEEPAAMDEAPEEEAKPAAKTKAKAAKGEEARPPAVPTDPAVLAVLESHPKTPAELLRAINILVDLGHAEVAAPLLDTLSEAKLDATAKAVLASQFNSATLLKLAHNSELGPAMGPFVDDLFKSAEAYRRDPKRLAAWASQLHDPNESVRAQATLALVRAREAAVAPLVDILRDPKRAAEHSAAQDVLAQLGDLAVAPLLGVLEGPDATLKTQVINVLGRTRAPQAVAPLLGPLLSANGTPELREAAGHALANIAGHIPNPQEALRLLEHGARRPLDQSRQEPLESSTEIEVWHWNAKRNQSMPIRYDATGASLATAVRLARELHQLDPSNAANRRLYLVALLQAAKFRGGLDKPLPTGKGTAHDIVAIEGADFVEDLLAHAMAGGYLPAATAAAQILSDIGSAEMLTRGGSAPCPLALAAQNSDRRLRFAAIDAIMRLEPSVPFPGSSYVADGLGFFASSYGPGRVLIAHPLSNQGQTLAGLAAELGYEADVATNGRRAFELGISSPDYEFVLIHSALARPAADELLAQLRRDRRTAILPVGFIAPWDDLQRVKRFVETVPRCEAFLQPQNSAEMKVFTAQVLSHAGRAIVSHAERSQQAIAALDWMIALGERPQHVFDLRKQEPAMLQVLYVGDLSSRAATVLGDLGSVRGQRSLLELAHLSTQPLQTRQAAVAAFGRSVQRHGLLLTREEISRQYDLYNSNAGRDADTSGVLGSILDAIERKGVPLDE